MSLNYGNEVDQMRNAYACLDEFRADDALMMLREFPAECAVRTAIYLVALGLVSERHGNAEIAEGCFDRVLALGVPLPALHRECARYFKRSGRFEDAYYCSSILREAMPRAIDEFLDNLSPELHQYSPHVVPKFMNGSRPRLYSTLPYKHTLRDRFGPEGAALIFSQFIGGSKNWNMRRLPVKSFYDFAKNDALEFEELIAPRKVTLPPPNIFNRTFDAAPQVLPVRSFFFCILPDAVVTSTSNIVIVRGNALLDFQDNELSRAETDFVVDPIVLESDGQELTILTNDLSETSRSFDQAFSLVGAESGVFGHWVTEYLPKLWACLGRPNFSQTPILIDEQMPSQHREAIEFFAGSQHPVIVIGPRESVLVKKLWCCSTVTYAPLGLRPGSHIPDRLSAVDATAFVELIHKLEPKLNEIERGSISSRRIFLRRKPEQKRKLLNAGEVESWFSSHGFEVLDFAELTFLEQVQAVREAEVIAGPDGSAFMMAFFACPGTRVGILSHEYLDNYGGNIPIFDGLGIRHGALVGDMTVEHASYRHFSDYSIDISMLEPFLDSLTAPSKGRVEGRPC